jgi:hypothetical protein
MRKDLKTVPAEILALAKEHGIDLATLELAELELEQIAGAGKPPGVPGGFPGPRPRPM